MLIKRLYTLCLILFALCVTTVAVQSSAFGESTQHTRFSHHQVELSLAGGEGGLSFSWQSHPAVTNDDEHSGVDEHGDSYILNVIRRLKSLDQCASKGSAPGYVAVFEFQSSLRFAAALTPVLIPSMQWHWTSRIPRTHARLAGWKESNLLYSHRFG